jgi:cytochrome P450
LLRRGTPYGGSLVREDVPSDSEPRGLHFVALNARIDQQFEFVQREWMNAGEIFGRAGLGRCPITGASEAGAGDTFAESGRLSGDAHLPRFVTTRGGDYFFVPSATAMEQLIAKNKFPIDETATAPGDGSARPTPELISIDRLDKYGKRILSGGARTIRVGVKPWNKKPQRVAFLARYDDVTAAQKDSAVYGEENYRHNSEALWGQVGIIGMPEGSAARLRWADTLYGAYQDLADALCGTKDVTKLHEAMSESAAKTCANIVARVTPSGRIDLLQDLGFYVPYVFAAKFFGVAGPNWLTQVAVASRFARYNVMEVPKQWLEQAPDVPASAWPYLTMQTWMRLSFIDIIANVVRRGEITTMARQAIGEYKLHIDQLIARERVAPTLTPQKKPATLLACLVARNPDDALTRLIITDLMAPLIVNVGAPFARVLEYFLDDVGAMPDFRHMEKEALNAEINEALRLKPSGPVQFRIMARDTKLPVDEPDSIEPALIKDDIAVLMAGAANLDGRTFKDPLVYKPGRPAHTYLNFGGPKEPRGGTTPNSGWKDADGTWTAVHHCWGERIGLLLLREMLKAASALPLLRRVPGLAGETVPLVGVPYNLNAKFSAGSM